MPLRRSLSTVLLSAIALLVPSLVCAQRAETSKEEIFGGYSWYRPGGTVNSVEVPNFVDGLAGQFTLGINHWTGFTADVNFHTNSSANAFAAAFGPRFNLPVWRFTPFGEVLLGFQEFNPKAGPGQNAATYVLGGGLDIRISRQFSVRPFQADYINTYYTAMSSTGGTNPFNGYRVQSGIIYHLGLPPEEGKVDAACKAAPAAVDSGSPVKVVVAASGFLRKRVLNYSYSSSGGKVTGNESSAAVDTTGLDAGKYVINAKVVDNGRGTHRQTAACQAEFSINAKHAPDVALKLDVDTVKPGDAVTITANGTSADNRPVSLRCTSDGGHLSGEGSTYTLDTSGVPEGTVNVSCTASDDRKLTASATSAVKVSAPVVAAAALLPANKFGTVEFKRDAKRPTRVDNEAKGELDRYADALAAAPDAKGVIVGYATSKEDQFAKNDQNPQSYAALRAVNTKDYVVKEKGIDSARIEPRSAGGDGQKAELWIAPPGASVPSEGTTVVDENKIKAVPRVALQAKVHKKAARSVTRKPAHKSQAKVSKIKHKATAARSVAKVNGIKPRHAATKAVAHRAVAHKPAVAHKAVAHKKASRSYGS